MKKLICFLIFLFLVPVACAEEAEPYTPGAVTQAQFSEAFARGDMLLADMCWDLTFSEGAADLYEVDAENLGALSEVLKGAALTAGVGRIEDGVRVLLAGQYEKDEQQAALDLTLDVTAQGLSLMSSAIPGERVSAKWETLLTLCGLSPDEAAQLMSLRELDVQAVLAEFLAEAEAMLALAGQIAAPYGETILSHISALPIEVREDVPAEAGFPAAATEISLSVTAKAAGDLIVALADQLKADTTMCALIDMALAESDEEITSAQLCQAIRDSAASMTDEAHPIYIHVGLNDDGALTYLNLFCQNDDGETAVLNTINAPAEDNPEFMMLTLDLAILTPEDTISDGVSLVVAYPQGAQDGTDVQVYLDVYAEGEIPLSSEFVLSEGAVTTEDALRGRAAVCSMLLTAADGADTAYIALTTDSLQSETAEGGEQITVAGTLDVVADDMQIPMTFELYSLTEKGQDGPVCTLTSFFRAPQLGVQEYIESYALYAAAYEPDLSAMTNFALETASSEEIEALAGRAMASLQQTADKLIELLPQAMINADSTAE